VDCSEGCPTAAVMFGVPGVRVLAAEPVADGLCLVVETNQDLEGCRECGVVAVLHDRREQRLVDAPFAHRQVRVCWRKRVGGAASRPVRS
jgi:transposase